MEAMVDLLEVEAKVQGIVVRVVPVATRDVGKGR